MKKILWFALLALLVLVSCSDKEDKKDSVEEKIDYSEYFVQSIEEAELCYFSYFDKDAFGSYIIAFSDLWVDEFAKENNMDRKTFDDKLERGCEKLAEERLKLYGENYQVEFITVLEEKIEGDELYELKKTLESYSIDTTNLTQALRKHYNITFWQDAEKDKVLNTYTMVTTLFKLDSDGWYFSPEDFLPVEFE